jgi:hypothetical protein
VYAILAPAGATPPGYVPTGLEVVTRPLWHRAAALQVPPADVQDLVSVAGKVVLATAEALWQLGRDGLERIANLPERRYGFALAAVEHLLLVVGGIREGARPDPRVLAFDAASNAWSAERQRMPHAREHAAVAVAGGLVHVLGGISGRGPLRRASRSHHVYDPAANRWAEAPPLPARRAGAVAAVGAGHIHLLGGGTGFRGGSPATAHDAYDTSQHAWVPATPLPGGRRALDATAGTNGFVALLGDHADRQPQTMLAYDPVTGVWERVPALPPNLSVRAVAEHAGGVVAAAADEAGTLALYEARVAAGPWSIFVPPPAGAPD